MLRARAGPARQRGPSVAASAAAERKPPGRSLERASNDAPRGMAVLDRIRLTGPPADVAPAFDEKAGALIFAKSFVKPKLVRYYGHVGSLRLDGIGLWFIPTIILRATFMVFLERWK